MFNWLMETAANIWTRSNQKTLSDVSLVSIGYLTSSPASSSRTISVSSNASLSHNCIAG